MKPKLYRYWSQSFRFASVSFEFATYHEGEDPRVLRRLRRHALKQSRRQRRKAKRQK